MSDDKIEIYKIHVQAADKIDERRDITVRTYGGICGVVAAIAASMILEYPAVSVMLWLFLLIVAFVWKETLSSLTSKLMAKANILREMEEQQLVSFPFLIKERAEWEASGEKPLQKVSKNAPNIFMWFGVVGVVISLVVLIGFYPIITDG